MPSSSATTRRSPGSTASGPVRGPAAPRRWTGLVERAACPYPAWVSRPGGVSEHARAASCARGEGTCAGARGLGRRGGSVARGAAQGRRREAAGPSRVLLEECAGLALLGVAAFAALSLWSYDPSDLVLSRKPVANAGGALGAAVAAGLLRSLGLGAALAVLGVGALGVRLAAGRGTPRLSSRFWLG